MVTIIDVLKKAVCAGNKALQYTRSELMLRHKEHKEVVTNCDIASENAITEALKSEYYHCSVYSEEVGNISGKEDLLFIIDPIDGTHNFIHGIPFYAISIGAYTKGQPFAGIIYLPEFDDYFYAIKGKGAFLNDKKVQTSNVAKLSNAMVAYDNQFHRHRSMLSSLPRLAESCFTLRIFGSAAVDICNVARGAIDARIFFNTKLVDFAAGRIIVEEAGGRITDFKGREITLETTDVVVSNGGIHDELIERLNLG